MLLRMILLFVLGWGALSAHADGPVKMMTNTWPPYIGEDLPQEGMAMELVRHVFLRAGYKVDNTIERWPRALEGVRVGLYDVLGAAWRDEERELDFIYSEPYLVNEIIVVTLKSNRRMLRSVSDLSGSRVGVLRDYSYGVDFDEIGDVTLVTENHMIQSLMNLLKGKVDYVIGDRRVIALMLSEYLPGRRGELEPLKITLPPRGLYVAGSRAKEGADELVDAFNRALADVKQDGSYREIVNRWDERYGL